MLFLIWPVQEVDPLETKSCRSMPVHLHPLTLTLFRPVKFDRWKGRPLISGNPRQSIKIFSKRTSSLNLLKAMTITSYYTKSRKERSPLPPRLTNPHQDER